MKIGNMTLPGSAWVAILTAVVGFVTANFDQNAVYVQLALVILYAVINWIGTKDEVEVEPVKPAYDLGEATRSFEQINYGSLAASTLAEEEAPIKVKPTDKKSRLMKSLFG